MQGSSVATCHKYLLTDFGIFLASSRLSEAEGRKCGVFLQRNLAAVATYEEGILSSA